jgi:hypothetical protein
MARKRRLLHLALPTTLGLGVASFATAGSAMAASGAIKGPVTDNNGANLAGICVTAFAPGHGAGGAAITDSSGNYAIQGLGTDPYQVRFSVVVVSGITLSARVFSAAGSGPSATSAKKKGTTVSFRLDRAATVVFTVPRLTQGRRVKRGGQTTCDRRTRANRKNRKCPLYITLRGSFGRNGAAGINKFHFTGRLNGKRLSPGPYRLVATPRMGHRSGTATAATFRIVR